jgi:hypothetical protein
VRGCEGARVRGCAGARVRGCEGARLTSVRKRLRDDLSFTLSRLRRTARTWSISLVMTSTLSPMGAWVRSSSLTRLRTRFQRMPFPFLRRCRFSSPSGSSGSAAMRRPHAAPLAGWMAGNCAGETRRALAGEASTARPASSPNCEAGAISVRNVCSWEG